MHYSHKVHYAPLTAKHIEDVAVKVPKLLSN